MRWIKIGISFFLCFTFLIFSYQKTFAQTTATPPISSSQPLPGDANGDNKVDGVDFIIWLSFYDQTKAGGPSVGDFNQNGKVDGVDYVIWLENYGKVPSPTNTHTPTPRPTATNTPRPSVSATATPTSTPTRTITNTPTPTTISGATYPAQILNLTNWKETLPLGSSGSPTEIKQPQLATYKIDPWFVVKGSGVQFRAAVNGVTTSGSSYPRSELREMTSNGTVNAAWSSTSGTHTMTVDTMVTHLPNTKPHLVIGQIHDSADDVSVFRVEGTTLWITDGNTTHGYAVDTNFTIPKRVTIKFEVSGGKIKYYYNGTLLPFTETKSFSGAYFKAGAYTQANCTNSSPCDTSNYGEVVMYSVTVTHQ